MKTYLVKTVPASYTLPLQTVPDPWCYIFLVYQTGFSTRRHSYVLPIQDWLHLIQNHDSCNNCAMKLKALSVVFEYVFFLRKISNDLLYLLFSEPQFEATLGVFYQPTRATSHHHGHGKIKGAWSKAQVGSATFYSIS